MSFANLKRQSGNLDKLSKAIEELSKTSEGGSEKSDNFWRPEVDKSGNGMATIRFLPASEKMAKMVCLGLKSSLMDSKDLVVG